MLRVQSGKRDGQWISTHWAHSAIKEKTLKPLPEGSWSGNQGRSSYHYFRAENCTRTKPPFWKPV